MSFSERYGYKPVKDAFQIDSMDPALRNGLWSLLKVFVWDNAQHSSGLYSGYYLNDYGNEELQALCQRLWFDYFKSPLDELENKWLTVLKELRGHFFKCTWNEAYDFVEFITNNYERHGFRDGFTRACNRLFEKEVSAYRFASGVITRVTDQNEIAEIETAIDQDDVSSSKHLRRALELPSDRDSPDYRNSIKESISAVEALSAKLVGSRSGTLGQLIKALESKLPLHPALKAAFSNLYGYTSDESGIRHALLEVDKVDFADAKFMLVVCSAFVNFVQAKVTA